MRLDDLRPTENAGKASATFDAPYKNWNTIQSLSIAATSAPVLDAKGLGRAGRLSSRNFRSSPASFPAAPSELRFSG